MTFVRKSVKNYKKVVKKPVWEREEGEEDRDRDKRRDSITFCTGIMA